jgi:hypothetical protein
MLWKNIHVCFGKHIHVCFRKTFQSALENIRVCFGKHIHVCFGKNIHVCFGKPYKHTYLDEASLPSRGLVKALNNKGR